MTFRVFGPRAVPAVVLVALVLGATAAANPAHASPPTFNKDVAAILFENCATCHRPNQVAPMTLTTFQEVRPWARAIKAKVVKGEMPPWYADGRFGEFRNDRRLTPDQIKTIVNWVDAGAPEGDTPLSARLPDFKDGWVHPSGRPPDFIIEMSPGFEVPASGELPNFTVYQELPPELKQKEHYLEAIQMLPSVVPAVHHASFGVAPVPPGMMVGQGEAWPGGPIVPGALLNTKTGKSAGFLGDANEAAGEGGARAGRAEALLGSRFCCYVPGGTFQQYRPGAGKRLPTTGYIAWGMHYTPIGKAVTDRTRVGLWFQNDMQYEVVENGGTGGQTHIVLGKQLVDDSETPLRKSGVGNAGFPAIPVIPPKAKDWAITAIRVFQDDATLYLAWPHMHTRGKEMTYVLTYPDGREQVLLSVPNYDFNWQIFYEFKEPIKIPAGSTVKTIGSYDNSAANKWNPAPHKEVYWSEQSWDEMYIGFMDVSFDKRVLKKQAAVRTDGGQ